ncbi:hypothetical protein DDE82_002624 [Stemphylium lycopersici]|nr:hypothetical protein DDE82_002624 [Stemphylium lycopersici]
MAHYYYPEPLSAIPGCSHASRIGDEHSYDYISVRQKLLFLNRPEFVESFEALRDGKSINEDVDRALSRLRKASMLVSQRETLIHFVARRLWPENSWQTWPDPSYSGMYLRTTETSDLNEAKERAFILIHDASNPASTLVLIGPYSQKTFLPRLLTGVFDLLKAVLDSEFAFLYRQTEVSRMASEWAGLPFILQKTQRTMPLWLLYFCASLSHEERAWVRQQNCQIRYGTRINAIKAGKDDQKRVGDGSTGFPKRDATIKRTPSPSILRVELLQSGEPSFRFIACPTNEQVGTEFAKIQTPCCRTEAFELGLMMLDAANFLNEKKASFLASELHRIRDKIMDCSEDRDDGEHVLSSAEFPENEHTDVRNRIFISCDRDGNSRIDVFMVNQEDGQKTWMVRIYQKCTRRIPSSAPKTSGAGPSTLRKILPKKSKLN